MAEQAHTEDFTPGPWRVTRRGHDNGFDIQWPDRIAPVYWPSGLEVARIVFKRLGKGGRFAGNAVDEANARLIAAAPDLLTSLRELLEQCVSVHDGQGSTDAELLEMERARAAIARATSAPSHGSGE